MGCVLCNLIQLSEKDEPFPSESARQDFMNELAGDIASRHPDLVKKIMSHPESGYKDYVDMARELKGLLEEVGRAATTQRKVLYGTVCELLQEEPSV
jgi:hypothetical protein